MLTFFHGSMYVILFGDSLGLCAWFQLQATSPGCADGSWHSFLAPLGLQCDPRSQTRLLMRMRCHTGFAVVVRLQKLIG